MSSKRTVMLLDALLPGADGAEKEALSALYKEAFSQTQEYIRLKSLLNDTLFVGDRGKELLSLGTGAMEKGLTQSGNYENNVANMIYVLENAERLLQETNDFIYSMRVDSQPLYVISNRDNLILKAFLENLVNVVCYYVTTLYGTQPLMDFQFDPEQNGPDMLRTLNAGISSIINYLKRMPKPRIWCIVRKKFSGGNVVHYNGFELKYLSTSIESLEANRIRKAPFFFLPQADNGELCAGVGRLSNLLPANGVAVLGSSSGVITSLDDRVFQGQTLDYQALDLIDTLGPVLDHRFCSVDPGDVVRALNRYFQIKTVEDRVAAGCCPLCGRQGAEVCENHFAIPQKDFDLNQSTIPFQS